MLLQRNALQEENRRLKQENLKLNLHLEQQVETVALYPLLRDEQVRPLLSQQLCPMHATLLAVNAPILQLPSLPPPLRPYVSGG